ncbi:MAG: 3-deoxy-D-manno-octulosonic acid transferase [Deltaproteobacteria bacterium]|nr:3-deoxy-D-manno-octulosonic acid transferase [Deltaproteobacteria bacterium]
MRDILVNNSLFRDYNAPMIQVYNFLLTFCVLLLLPLIALIIMVRAKYRGRTLERMGFKIDNINKKTVAHNVDNPVIWIHALSVGEVTSALPLVKAIRDDMDSSFIVFTTATRSGKQVADTLIAQLADIVLYSPFDLSFAVQRYITAIDPNLFILVETDFWPNWLRQLKSHKIPAMLVNGRISEKSFVSYNRFLLFFKPMFRCFDLLSMQTTADANKMIDLGIDPEKVIALGNLKYDMATKNGAGTRVDRVAMAIDEDLTIWVCGSTHPGEENFLFAAFKELTEDNNSFLILAPRDISRGSELVGLARQFGLEARTRTSRATGGKVLILDTIGELASCYGIARLAFVGGSLVAQGGHNPIEPAAYRVPVLFGSHMEDFTEIAHDLVACGGAETVTAQSLATIASGILKSDDVHAVMAEAAMGLVEQHRGGVANHLQAIHRLLRK